MRRQSLEKNLKMAKSINTIFESREKVKPISLDWYWAQPSGDKILMKIRPTWPSDLKAKDVVLKDLREFVEDRIGSDLKKDFIRISDVSENKVTVEFDGTRWLRENFLKDPRVEYEFPRTLVWKFKKRLPSTLMSHTSHKVVKDFVEEKFKEFIKDNHKMIFRKKLKIMKKVNYNWFTYQAELQYDKIFVRLKTKVMITLAAAGYMAKKALSG